MSNNKSSITARAKKFITSVAVLLIFIFPLAVSLRWIRDVVVGNDHRIVYSKQDIANFQEQGCSVGTEDIKPFDEPLITVTFDDGWESVYSQGVELLESNCIKSTQYILGDNFEDLNYLSKKQVHSMQDAGHEIASHSMEHPNLTQVTDDSLVWELGESDRLLTNEFGEIREFATPLGANNQKVLDEVMKHYRSHRNTDADPAEVGDEDINVRETFNRYQINAYTVRKDTKPEDIQRLIDYTIKRKGWLILTYHQVDESDAEYAVTKQQLQDQLKLVRRSGVRTPVMGRVLDVIMARGRGGV